MVHQIDSKNEWPPLSVTPTAKPEPPPAPTSENAPSQTPHPEANRTGIAPPPPPKKKRYQGSPKQSPAREISTPPCDNQRYLERLSVLQLWNKFSGKRKLECRFLIETIKIENTSFPFKTARSEANVKANRMTTTKWTHHKECSFASNYFIFLENLFQL